MIIKTHLEKIALNISDIVKKFSSDNSSANKQFASDFFMLSLEKKKIRENKSKK